MNQIFAAGAAFILAGVLWGLGKKPQSFETASFAKSLPITPKSLLFKKISLKAVPKILNEQKVWEQPSNAKERLDLAKHLEELMLLGPEGRLKAIQIASDWGDKSVIPLLKRGLKDADSGIVCIAAKAMEKFRCHSPGIKPDQIDRPPLNVFLMR